MQKFKIIGKPLLGEKYVEGRRKEERIMPTHNVRAHALHSHQNNAKFSGHYVRPRTDNVQRTQYIRTNKE